MLSSTLIRLVGATQIYNVALSTFPRNLTRLWSCGMFSDPFSFTAAQLRDAAPIPKEACNFLRIQRQLFEERRKNQADAIEFLHQFRADDDFVLRSARRSLGTSYDSHSATQNSTSSYKSLEPGKTPDARAHIYSYAVYPNLNQTNESTSKAKHDTIPDESTPRRPETHVPDIIRDSVSFQHAFEALELTAKEASLIPLPEDGDFSTDRKCTDQSGMQEDASQLSPAAERITEESECENCNSILILQGEIDDDEGAISKQSERDAAGDSSATPFIPFEAFSRLGESLVLESRQAFAPSNHDDSSLPLEKSDSDEESLIPGMSFMQLGASMMANDLSLSSKENDDKKPMVSPVKESEQSAMESSDLISITATDVTVSQDSTGLKSLTIETAPCQKTKDEHPKEACCNVEETNENLNKDVFEDTVTPKRSNRNDFVFDNEKVDLEDRIIVDKEEANVERKKSSENDTACDRDVENFENSGSDEVEKIDEWVIITMDDLEPVARCDDERTEKEERLEEEEEIFQNFVKVDEDDTNDADAISEQEEEKMDQNEDQTPMNSEVTFRPADSLTMIDSANDDAPRRDNQRSTTNVAIRRRKKKNKKKGNHYVPSSSLFVSRQFLSR